MNLARVDVEIDAVVRDDAGEGLGDASKRDEAVVGALLQVPSFYYCGRLGDRAGPRAVSRVYPGQPPMASSTCDFLVISGTCTSPATIAS